VYEASRPFSNCTEYYFRFREGRFTLLKRRDMRPMVNVIPRYIALASEWIS